MSCFFVYVTFENERQAKEISSKIVENRLAACANIFQPHTSIYWWEEKLETAQGECVAIFKTTEDNFDRLKEKILELHSYDVPCIVALPIKSGYDPFMQWVETEVLS